MTAAPPELRRKGLAGTGCVPSDQAMMMKSPAAMPVPSRSRVIWVIPPSPVPPSQVRILAHRAIDELRQRPHRRSCLVQLQPPGGQQVHPGPQPGPEAGGGEFEPVGRAVEIGDDIAALSGRRKRKASAPAPPLSKSAPAPPSSVSAPAPPAMVSAPSPPTSRLAPALPVIILARALPVPFSAALPVRTSAWRCAPSVQDRLARTVSVP